MILFGKYKNCQVDLLYEDNCWYFGYLIEKCKMKDEVRRMFAEQNCPGAVVDMMRNCVDKYHEENSLRCEAWDWWDGDWF